MRRKASYKASYAVCIRTRYTWIFRSPKVLFSTTPMGYSNGGGKFRRQRTCESFDDLDAKIVKRIVKAAAKL
ncbi:hypothetical protein CA13_18260 [Planctomycetes bacterium CA13]|uniref:Uncharacterized protein n=1 Tax=Novipirellula herctigrandis TaxID=2527986 RepID=A0A5C5YZN8_9BACT|nr:hypothetical protein CA13_18260 [Planctomycetes bacterium CA13]